MFDAVASADKTGGGSLEFICADFLIRGAEILPTFKAGRTMCCGCTAVLGTSTLGTCTGGWIGCGCTVGVSADGFLADGLATGSTGFASPEVLTIGALVSDATASDGTARGARFAAAGGFCTPGITPR